MRYDYQCTKCDQIFEVKRSYQDEGKCPLTYCPHCGKPAKRVFGIPSVRISDLPTQGGKDMDTR